MAVCAALGRLNLAFHPCPCWWIYQMQLPHINSFGFPSHYLTSGIHIFPHTHSHAHPAASADRFPYWSPTRSSESPGDGEHGLTREWGMKTECWKTQAAGGKSIRVEDVFPWNQIVHIFIFAHRPTPTGHQYAKPKACCVCLLFATREGTESNSFQ